MPEAHIVLDLDQTLVNDNVARPGLSEFLHFCFSHFASVSIWTAAEPGWWSFCYNEHMVDHGFVFSRVLTRADCDQIVQSLSYNSSLRADSLLTLKPLSKLWKDASTGMRPTNTLIVDDTPTTAAANPENLIPITAYIRGEDDALFSLMDLLELRLAQFHETGDIRSQFSNSE